MRKRATALLSVCLLVACGGGSGGNAGMTPPAPSVLATGSNGSSALNASTFQYGAFNLSGTQYVGQLSGSVAMGVDVELTPQNASGLASYAAATSNKKSPFYRHFLTPQEIGARYGASSANVAAAAKYFASYHLHVGTWPQHLSLFVSGAQDELAKAFGTTFGLYRSGSTEFIAPMSTPKFSQTLPVLGVTRLITMQRAFRDFVPGGAGGNALTMAGYLPQQIRNAFDYTSAYNAGYTGTGITIGIVGTGPISSADVPAYGAMFDTQVATVAQHDVTDQGVAAPGIENPPDTGFATPPPATADCNGFLPACNPEDVEAQVDTETTASLAPGATIAFYLGYDPAYCINEATQTIVSGPCTANANLQALEGVEVSDDEIQQVIADNLVDVLSISYGGPEQANAGYEFSATDPDSGLGPQEFAALAAEGVAVFVSSGDTGAEGCQNPVYAPDLNQPCVSYPATDPSVTAVGGNTVPLDNFGNLTNQIIGWGLTTGQGAGGSGGGVSAYFPQSLTPWQEGIPGVIGSNRNQPDLSMLGDPETGMATLLYASLGGPDVESVGGTSVAAPETAAMWALVLQACKSSTSCATAQGAKPYRLGNAAPILYGLYADGQTILPTYAQTFYDVVYGDNAQSPQAPGPTASPLDPGYNAGPGYDQVTGIGVPFARALIKAVTHQ
jgi:subtilase family serine protease